MGKVVTIYLSDDEARSLKGFCDENRCTQYSALKTAVKQLLYSPVEAVNGDTWVKDKSVDKVQEDVAELIEDTEEIEEVEGNKKQDSILTILEKARGQREENEKDSIEDPRPSLLRKLRGLREEKESVSK